MEGMAFELYFQRIAFPTGKRCVGERFRGTSAVVSIIDTTNRVVFDAPWQQQLFRPEFRITASRLAPATYDHFLPPIFWALGKEYRLKTKVGARNGGSLLAQR
jgi:hypothetical protein